ncbi:unnamed protein product [Cylindrotheca closterium]|uniref:VWFD domain-containing protein n=1 Tax=Cylindrotheca closterium TaxID=2856 RepID=A0AAD2CIF0_9STRA|nr:unnamed protein product [Cylindrotheca closterium]
MKFELIITLLSTVLLHARASGRSGDVTSTTTKKKKNNNNKGHEGKEIEYDTTFNGEGLSAAIRSPLLPPGGGGNTHIITWNNEHYKYDGQCDVVMMKDEVFAQGLGLHVHIRTKIVGYWSYIQSIAIQIGNDILEIEGSTIADEQAHYWINYEYQGDLDNFAGFSVTQSAPSAYKRHYTIDLNPNSSIVVQVYKEFVRLQFNGDESVFGNTVGLLGDYMTGKTHARDGITAIDDFTNLGDQWQVLPYEKRLFREASRPQFPEPCWKPKDPRGERRRHLADSQISYAQAEHACFRVMSDPLSIKDCVNDILATQDLEMVGAYE